MSGVPDVFLMIAGERLGCPVRLLARRLPLGPSRRRQSGALLTRQPKITRHAFISLHINDAGGISEAYGAADLLPLRPQRPIQKSNAD